MKKNFLAILSLSFFSSVAQANDIAPLEKTYLNSYQEYLEKHSNPHTALAETEPDKFQNPQYRNPYRNHQWTKTKQSKEYNATSGSYLGLDLLQYRTSFLVHDSVYGQPFSYPPSNHGSSYGIGLNYRYAFNYKRFFLAPGIFFEYNNTGEFKGRDEVSLNTRNRYGAKLDLGYDLTDNFSPYFTTGYSHITYRNVIGGDGLTPDPNGPHGYQIVTLATNDSENSPFVGVGFKYNLSRHFALNMEYQRQSYKALGQAPEESRDYLSNPYFVVKLQIFKAGLSYHF